MNKEIMKALADVIESLPSQRFNMQYWSASLNSYEDDNLFFYSSNVGSEGQLSIHNCKTAGCIGGWAVAFANNMYMSELYDSDIMYHAEQILGLENDDAGRLFFTNEGSIWMKYRKELGLQTECEKNHGRLFAYDTNGVISTVCAERDDDDCYDHTVIEMSSVTNIAAAKLLRGIVSGEYTF